MSALPPVKNYGAFNAQIKIGRGTAAMLGNFSRFIFPDYHFSAVDTRGRTKAVAIDYLKGVKPTQVVLATGTIGKEKVKLAIASSTRDLSEIIIDKFGAYSNYVAKVSDLTIESVHEFSRPSLPIISPPSRVEASETDLTRPLFGAPDFTYQPHEPPLQKTGTLKSFEREYLEYSPQR